PATSPPSTVVTNAPSAQSVQSDGSPAMAQTTISATPSTVLAPAAVREWSQPTFGERVERFVNVRSLLFSGLLLAGLVIIAWVGVHEVRRHRVANVPIYRSAAPARGPRFTDAIALADEKKIIVPIRFVGGPPQISLQLKTSEPSLKRAASPLGKPPRAFGSAIATPPTDDISDGSPSFIAPAGDQVFHEGIGEPIVGIPEAAPLSAMSDSAVFIEEAWLADPQSAAGEVQPAPETIAEVPAFIAPAEEIEYAGAHEHTLVSMQPEPAVTQSEVHPIVEAPTISSEALSEPVAVEASIADAEPIGQGQPIPYKTPAFDAESATAVTASIEPEKRPSLIAQGFAAAASFAGLGAIRSAAAQPASIQETIPIEDPTQQPTTSAMTPQPTPPAAAPATRTAPPPSAPGAVPQPQPQPKAAAGGMQTAVQLTLSFEIASLQLTPSFKMGALQLKPTSKIVTMRLAPSQQPQPAMNLQVTFEIATVQLAGNSLGQIRLTPSQQKKPGISASPAFNIAGLQLLSGESGAVQLTPSQQGQASVHMTARFEIATVEFSPSFEIASLVLNSTSKSVLVQLPGSDQTAVEGAPVFEISNVQLAGNGEIGMMQLIPKGGGQGPT
ncbi:MAG: hypothetical protein ABI944_01185, partial [Chthoniobacterales bacterium]